jgi:DNA-binding response OmpR family regulator
MSVDDAFRTWQNRNVTAAEIIKEIKALSREDQSRVLTQAIEEVSAHERKEIAKLLQRVQRRLEHPEIPEDVWEGFEQAEDGRTVDMKIALTQPPPFARK